MIPDCDLSSSESRNDILAKKLIYDHSFEVSKENYHNINFVNVCGMTGYFQFQVRDKHST